MWVVKMAGMPLPFTRTVIELCLQDCDTSLEHSITLIERSSTVTFLKRC